MKRALHALGLGVALAFTSSCQFFFPTPIDKETAAPNASAKEIKAAGPGTSFKVGEVMKADVFLDAIRAGTGELRVKQTCDMNGKPAILLELSGASTGFARFLKSADTKSSAYLDADTGLPLTLFSASTIGDDHTEAATVYLPSEFAYRQVRTDIDDRSVKPHIVARAEALPLEGIPNNADSLLGYVRSWRPAQGATGYIFAAVGRYVWRLDMTFVGPETLTMASGEEKAVRIDCTSEKLIPMGKTLEPSQVSPKRAFSIWVSDDERHTPLRVLVETDLAKITIELTSYKFEPPAADAADARPMCKPLFDEAAVRRDADAGTAKRAKALEKSGGDANDGDDDDKEEKDGIQKIERSPG